MVELKKRIKRRVYMTYKRASDDCSFSIKLAIIRIFDELACKLHFIKISKFWHKRLECWILNYLTNLLLPILQKRKSQNYVGEYTKKAPIWACWWTGEEEAPQLVKQCIKSIRLNAGEHPFYLIDRNNFRTYLDIPDCIMNRFQSGEMCAAHFSDYMRFSLLEKYGGLWLDATIFCTQNIDEKYFDSPFFSCRSAVDSESRFISRFRWTTFCVGGWKKSVLFTAIREALEYYWSKNNRDVDYLFLDYLIEVFNNNIPAVNKILNEVPINNLQRDNLQEAFGKKRCADDFFDIISEDTRFYKLSWREEYSLVTPDGAESTYAYFLRLDCNRPLTLPRK